MEPEPIASCDGGDSAETADNCGGPAPFLLKTYDMVDDSSTDDIVSWSSSNASFVVWNPPDFSSRLLPSYFKHNNFSSFIRQLNTYGFGKIDPERWEFANDEFVKGQKHLLKNIHRRKPIHSRSNPPLDAERAALEEEIERLQRDKAALQADLWRFKQQQSGTKVQLEVLERRLRDMEQRQAKMVAFLQRAIQNPKFVMNLAMMVCSSELVLHKKRKLPRVQHCAEAADSSFCENSSSNSKSAEVGHIFSQDFCDKLKLELCPAISDSNLFSPSTQGSNEGGRSPQGRLVNGGCVLGMDCVPSVSEIVELSDAGASFCSRRNSLLAGALDDSDALVSCHLNLTLASSSIPMDSSNNSRRILSSVDLGVASDPRPLNENAVRELADAAASPTREVSQAGIVAPLPAAGRVNDNFWEQFLTERPGSSDTEEAISSQREDPCQESQEERMLGKENSWRSRNDIEQLTL